MRFTRCGSAAWRRTLVFSPRSQLSPRSRMPALSPPARKPSQHRARCSHRLLRRLPVSAARNRADAAADAGAVRFR